jgi:hypothetical protein
MSLLELLIGPSLFVRQIIHSAWSSAPLCTGMSIFGVRVCVGFVLGVPVIVRKRRLSLTRVRFYVPAQTSPSYFIRNFFDSLRRFRFKTNFYSLRRFNLRQFFDSLRLFRIV